jgi:phenylalanyl-tRNA synthetase alpha chain
MMTTAFNDLQTLLASAALATEQVPALASLAELEALRLEWLGRSGQLTLSKRLLKNTPSDDRPALGQALNETSQRLEAALNQATQRLEAEVLTAQLAQETLDVTLPGVGPLAGRCHPIQATMDRIATIFTGMGFTVLDDNACPEVETDYYNFEALNFPDDHPARDMQDTFYTSVAPNVLLRSQTSNAQIRYMAQNKPPFRVLAPGRVYRNEEVTSRKHVLFHQVEGLLVAKDVRFSDLKGTLNAFIAQWFSTPGQETVARPTRFRPSFFPFTEPSAEVDVQCLFCKGEGCKVCSQSGWLEILGAGMVHPNVLANVGIDPQEYSGFAFGMGVERLCMLRDAVDDIRLFYQNDLRLLRQFND